MSDMPLQRCSHTRLVLVSVSHLRDSGRDQRDEISVLHGIFAYGVKQNQNSWEEPVVAYRRGSRATTMNGMKANDLYHNAQ